MILGFLCIIKNESLESGLEVVYVCIKLLTPGFTVGWTDIETTFWLEVAKNLLCGYFLSLAVQFLQRRILVTVKRFRVWQLNMYIFINPYFNLTLCHSHCILQSRLLLLRFPQRIDLSASFGKVLRGSYLFCLIAEESWQVHLLPI